MPLDNGAFWLALFYVTLPLGMLIYAGNDLSDAETDRHNPRKDSFLFGARPTPDQRCSSCRWRIFLIQDAIRRAISRQCGASKRWLGLRFWRAGSALYNRKRGGAKDLPVVDLLSQCGYLLVFVLSDWTRGATTPWFVYAFGFGFAMHSHLLRANHGHRARRARRAPDDGSVDRRDGAPNCSSPRC